MYHELCILSVMSGHQTEPYPPKTCAILDKINGVLVSLSPFHSIFYLNLFFSISHVNLQFFLNCLYFL